MIDGTFPDVQRIIPTSCVSKMLVDSYEIAGTIDRTNFIRNDKVHLIKLECSTSVLMILVPIRSYD